MKVALLMLGSLIIICLMPYIVYIGWIDEYTFVVIPMIAMLGYLFFTHQNNTNDIK
jgi:hypothetical protein